MDLNCRPLELEATALPTGPQPLPNFYQMLALQVVFPNAHSSLRGGGGEFQPVPLTPKFYNQYRKVGR